MIQQFAFFVEVKDQDLKNYKKNPKPLLLINKKTIIEYKIDWYKKQNFNNLIFCLGYLQSKFQVFFKKKKLMKIESSKISNGILKRIFLVKKFH